MQPSNWASRQRSARLAALSFGSGVSHAAWTQVSCINVGCSHKAKVVLPPFRACPLTPPTVITADVAGSENLSSYTVVTD